MPLHDSAHNNTGEIVLVHDAGTLTLDAIAGAAGYGVLNPVIFDYACYTLTACPGTSPTTTTAHLTVGGVATSLLRIGIISVGTTTTLSPTAVAAPAALACLSRFVGILLLVSSPPRVVARLFCGTPRRVV